MNFWRVVKVILKVSSFIFLFVFLLFVFAITILRVLSPNWSIIDILRKKEERKASYSLTFKVVDKESLRVEASVSVSHGQPTWPRCLYWGDGKDKVCLKSPGDFTAEHTYSKRGRYLIRLMSGNINLVKPIPVDFRE